MATNNNVNNINFEATQIKNYLIEKLANETKINEFIRNYFKVGEKKIFDIYEGIVNFFLKTDELWKFKDDFKIFVEEESGFLLDKIMAWYSIDENKLYELLFEKLKLTRDQFWDKGIYIFTRSIFQHWVVENFFNWLKSLSLNWKENYIDAIIKSLRIMVGTSVVKLIKDEVMKDLMSHTEWATEKDIEDNYGFILDWMLNKRLIEKNFSTIVTKMIEYFRKKNIDLYALIDGYKDFFNEITWTDYIKDFEVGYHFRKQNNKLTKSFVNFTNNKQSLFLNSKTRTATLWKLKELVGEKKAREYIWLSEKSNLIIKQQNAAQIFLEEIIDDLKVYYKELIDIKYQKISIKDMLNNIQNKDIYSNNAFYKNVNALLSEYSKTEKIEKIKQMYKSIEDFYDTNIMFDDLFQKIVKIEEFWIFYDYQNQESFVHIKDIVLNIVKTKEEKTKEIINALEKNLLIIKTLWEFYLNNDLLLNLQRQKIKDKLIQKDETILAYLLDGFEEVRNRSSAYMKKQWVQKFFHGISNEKIISLTLINDFLLDIKNYANQYNINHFKKELIFVDRFFSPSNDDKMNQLKNFLKIWMLASGFGRQFSDLNIYFKNNAYIKEIRKLYNFANVIRLSKKYTMLVNKASLTKNNEPVYWRDYIMKHCSNVEFFRFYKKIDKYTREQKIYTEENLKSMSELWDFNKDMNEIARIFLKFIFDNNELLEMCERFDDYIYSAEEIDMIYWMYHLINSTGVQIETHDDYVLVYFRNKIFVFFSNPTFTTFNNVSLLLEQKGDYEHIFIYTHINFYLYLTWLFSKNINVKGLQQNFKQVMLLSFYDDEISDLTVYWDKKTNTCYFLVRKKGKYHMVWFKKADFVQTVFSFNVMESVIENVIFMGGAVTSEKQSDTAIKFWWVNYRIGVMKDWERVGMVMRKAQNVWLRIDLKKHMDENGIVLKDVPLPYKKEWFTLADTYDEEDVSMMLDYVAQTSWVIIISGSTGSGKSVSMRNFLNHVFESTLKDWYWKKIASFEDPIEANNSNFMQFEFKKEDLPSAVLGVKRFDLDVALIWEIRDYTMLPGLLEAQDVIACKTTIHSPTVWSALFLLKKWAVASKVDLVDIIYAVKILMAQKLSFYLKEKYQSPEQQEYYIKDGSIKLIYPDSKEETEILNDFHELVRWVLGKDTDYNAVIDKINKWWEWVSDYFKRIIHTEWLIMYLIKELVKRWVLKYKLKDNVTRRKVYYELIDRVKMKLEFNIMYTVLTWENIIGRELQEDEADINKLMIKLLRKTRDQRALEDFFRWYMERNVLGQYSKEYFILVLMHMFQKNNVKTKEDVDLFIEKLLNNEKIL